MIRRLFTCLSNGIHFMNIVIAGGGRVGFHLARMLATENHDITVIEADQGQIDHVDYSLDVSTTRGRAEDVLQLQEVGVGASDLFLACTGSDEVNLIAATTAKGLGAKKVVARVENRIYNESDILYEHIMGIDYMLSPQGLTAHEIATYIENPGITATESFGQGKIQMQQFKVNKAPTSNGQTLKDLKLPDGVLIGLIHDAEGFEIPQGKSIIKVNDTITLIGEKERMSEARKLFKGQVIKHEKIALMGGSRTSVNLAQILEKTDHPAKLMEYNMKRCEELVGTLKKTKVVCRDAASRLSLEQEHIDGYDLFVAATHDDERNIMASVLAKEVGVKEALAVVHQPDFAPLLGKLGIDHAVTPRACFANSILKLTMKKENQALAILEDGEVEILEFSIEGSAQVYNQRLMDIKFPADCLVGTIQRGEEIIVPTGIDTLQRGDSIIVITRTLSVASVRKLFQS
jgi:trk system potassium uptake protein TrkA